MVVVVVERGLERSHAKSSGHTGKKKSNIYIGWLIIKKASTEKLHFHQGKKSKEQFFCQICFKPKHQESPHPHPPPPQCHQNKNIGLLTSAASQLVYHRYIAYMFKCHHNMSLQKINFPTATGPTVVSE